MAATIRLATNGTGFKVVVDQPGLTVAHYFDEYHKALIKSAVLRVKHTKGKERPIFINEVVSVQTA